MLVPHEIHEKVAHLGGRAIHEAINVFKRITKTEFNNWFKGKV